MGGEFRRIVVMLPTWVGDAVMATPALAALRRGFPGAHIAWMGTRAACETLSGLDLADELIGDASRSRRLGGILWSIRRLRAGRFDLGVLLTNTFRSAAVFRLGGVAVRLGYNRECRGWLLSEALPVPRGGDGRRRPVPAVCYYLELVRAAGCDAEDRTMRLAVQAADAAQAEHLLASAGCRNGGPVVIVNPAASFGSSKLWPPERFAAVADALHARCGAHIILHAGPGEGPIAAAVAAAMRTEPALEFASRAGSLGLLKALTARAALVITGDTGPRHIAAALGTPVVTLFGPTDPAWTTIDFPGERIVRVDVDCGPCRKKRCPLPAGEAYHKCMRLITPEMVLTACEWLLNESLCD